MVGDNPFADIRAAASLGMSTCWLAPLARAVPEGCSPTFRISRLSELLAQLQLAPFSSASAPCTA
jgi:FMN phosphatase YigB (HAD superfamily)